MFNTSLNNGGSEKVGTIKAFGGSVAPFGWLICDGSEISRTLYAALFDVIGETYGAGDGSTTFNLPNGKMPIGNVGAQGNDTSLGLTNGVNNYGLSVGNGSDNYLQIRQNQYGVNIGTANSGSGAAGTGSLTITKESEKSGIVIDLTKATAASLAIIKY